MKYKLIKEEEILDQGFRKKIIEEIKGPENIARKADALKRHDCYKDQTKKWVLEALRREFEEQTVEEMSGRVSNISIARKIVDKLAQTYVHGVDRLVEDELSQEAIDKLERELDLNTKMKKADRGLELHKNEMVQIVPKYNSRQSDIALSPKYDIVVRPMAPYEYDVIEDFDNRTMPRVVILTDFVERKQIESSQFTTNYANLDGGALIASSSAYGDSQEQIISDSPEDAGQQCQTYIWWSDKYHFTTDDKGQIISKMSPEDGLNPIQIMPFINLAEDQAGHFWARGGEDLIDASILINKLITDMLGIASAQGWGQIVMVGNNLPSIIKTGPHRAVLLNRQPGEDAPTFDFKSADPPIDSWMRMIEQYIALMLSTNNLSPSTVAGKLDVISAPSGIAILIEKAESTVDLKDREQLYQDKEPEMWEIIRRWQNLYFESGSLTQRFMDIGPFEDSNVRLKFMNNMPVITEEQRLNEIKLRKELGLNTMIELLMIDNPDLSLEEAEEKLKKIMAEKLSKMSLISDQQVKEKPEVEMVEEDGEES